MPIEDRAESECLEAQTSIVVSVSQGAWSEAHGEIENDCVSAATAALVCGLADMGCALPGAEISIVLADDSRVHDLNRRHRGRDLATDILSFPSMTREQLIAGHNPVLGAPVLLGDIVLAFETVRKNAGEQGKTLHEHVSHLIVHGVLHLLGFDHDTRGTALVMEGLERTVLRQLEIGDPYVVE